MGVHCGNACAAFRTVLTNTLDLLSTELTVYVRTSVKKKMLQGKRGSDSCDGQFHEPFYYGGA